MAQEIVTVENVNNRKATKEKVELAKRIKEYEVITPEMAKNGLMTSKEAARLLSRETAKDIPVTTVNNLAYAGKIEAIRVGGIFLLTQHGENSVTAYVPELSKASTEKTQRQEEKSRKAASKDAVLLFKQWVNHAVKNNLNPSDMEAFATWKEAQEHAQEE